MTQNYFFILLATFLASLVLVRLSIPLLTRRVMDVPNERSSHEVPTPRGGGLPVMVIILSGLGFLLFSHILEFPNTQSWNATFVGGILLALVSLIDDWKKDGIAPRWRFLVQILAVVVPLVLLPAEDQIFPQYLGLVPERVLIGLAWLWFLNLYNFMDGINAITGVETVSISGGLVAVCLLAGMPLENGFTELNLIIAGSALGFLFWNARRHARVFLGDVGSIGFGYLLGWILILIALEGNLTVALLLPLVYVTDATITLGIRTFRRQRIWEAHRTHFYQRATHIKGLTHLQTSGMTLVINLLLILLASLAVMEFIAPWQALIGGVVLVKLLLLIFYKIGRRAD